MMNVASIVTHILQIGVTVGAVVPDIPFVMANIGPIFSESGSVPGALVACNIRSIAIQIAPVMVDVLLILANTAHITITVTSIPAQIPAIVSDVFLIL
jgi:hypothetical protein